ncbi:MAG: hypothetical protein B6244_14345 [Candidatus Cloacimonetes bacterium 4572_55]|nr:MAG: hypothetical protein B6244_14345 [Candidatus Cloacimonetes bacterium 4572_55]
MKKTLIIFALVLVCCAGPVYAQLDPATTAITNIRTDSANAFVPGGDFYKSTTLNLTNNLCLIGGTGTVQDLTDITVELRLGSITTNLVYTGNVSDAAAGLWGIQLTTPTNANPRVQVKLTHTNGTIYIYPWKVLRTAQSLE